MTFHCDKAQTLIASYADSELSEAQSKPLRKHLMECSACRLLVQDQKAMARWFEPTEAVGVPNDFAARVARRAFAGDTGERDLVLAPTSAASSDAQESSGTLLSLADSPRGLRSFAASMSGLAAAAALLFVVVIRQAELPDDHRLRADETVSFDGVRQRLIELNTREALPSQAPVHAPGDSDGPEDTSSDQDETNRGAERR